MKKFLSIILTICLFVTAFPLGLFNIIARAETTTYTESFYTYTVLFDANGGNNAPTAQTKIKGVSLTVTSSTPTRTGYKFRGWATTPDGVVVYKAGDEYIEDKDITLYAKWIENCATCFGKGFVKQLDTCPSCEGDGIVLEKAPCGCGGGKNCSTCGGKGWVNIPVECFDCEEGYYYKNITCDSCGGKGVTKELELIIITESPKKIIYSESEQSLTVTGGKITIYFTDDSTEVKPLTASMISGFDNTLSGPQNLIITYGEKTTTYETKVKLVQTLIPLKPTISSFTDTIVTLIAIEGCEYSRDGINWQISNVFNNLYPATSYIFYQRYAENDTYSYGEKSIGTSITTDKSKQTLIPDAPTVQSFTENSITLNSVDGCEYSKDGINWQTSNVFSGLSCGTEYNFYQRYKETTTTYVGKSSKSLVTRTDKGLQTAPSKPTLSSKTHNSITLKPISGYEYSRDGINWQLSNVFKGLVPETNYMFYQRKAESDRYYVSPSSIYLTVKTSEAPECVLNSLLHQYNNTCDTECNICGGVREVTHNYKWIVDKLNNCGVDGIKHEECSICYTKRNEGTFVLATGKHTYSNSCDTTCNVCKATRTITHVYKTTTTKATTSSNGKIVKKCNLCSKVFTTTIKYVKTFKLSTTSYTYNGKEKKPSVKVYDAAGKLISSSNYTIKYKDNKKVGKATVTVTFKGNYSGTKTLSFKINPKSTKVSKITAAKKSLKVKIKKQSTQTTGYQIQYSTSSKFKSAKTKTTKSISYTIKSLKAKKTYYVRVRTYKSINGKKYYSGWSTAVKKKTK